ncbi:nucleolar protein dao-5 isoform X2 [Trifolium pratense]|uniref:nucleolar protein dao-5 isoform X2 n=1 Tax=Trifolium pratense TaxID=57577 RepID=UPI001E696EA5|nr:nucleolar protein dao-5 isoform X2 [Trifolium pratense]
MPGTIMVSVLEFMDLPFSSSTSIRASLGKIEYQISDKGNFSFPLTSLRDDLIFKIQDAEGKEISRAGVHIRLILEKGVWEDMFPLGEGQLHLKLQVVLSDEERDRIRMMRQSALKKKQDELLSIGQRDAESNSSSMIIGNAALPFNTSDEVSESSPKQHLQHEAVSQIQSPVASSNDDKESSARNVVEAQPEQQQQIKSNVADQYKKTSTTKPVSQAVSIIKLQDIGKKPANQSPPKKHPQRVTSSEELVNLLSSEKIKVVRNNLVQNNLEDDGLQNTEKKVPPRRTPSNVMKMISAFESGMPKDMRPHIKPPPTKYQVIPIEKKDSSETRKFEQDTLNIEPRGFYQEKAKSTSLVRNMQQVPEHIGESKEQINTLNRKTDSNLRNTDQEEETNNKVSCSRDQEEEKNNRNLMATSTFETVKRPLKEEKRRDKDSEVTYESCIEKDLDNNYYSFESSEAMIFQKIKNIEKNEAYIETGIEESKYERIENIEESKTNTSDDDNGDENSGGPFNQVIKVAIIIGFGLLVLLTRQRKKRKEKSSKE